MNWLFLNVMIATLIVSWWLSGFDSGLSGRDDHRWADFLRRAIRCGVSLFLMAIAVGGLQGGALGPLGTIAVALPLGIVWASCLSEASARVVHALIDSEDKRKFDPKHIERELDRLASLVQGGRNEEAIRLCQHLLNSGDASGLAMETLLYRLFDQMYADDRLATAPGLAAIWQSRSQGRFEEAEAKLNELLKQNPGNQAAAFLLLRIYARDLHRPDRAQALMQALGQQHNVLSAFIGFASRRVSEWSAPKEETSEGIEALLANRELPPPTVPEAAGDAVEISIDELLAEGRLATAIEMMEDALKREPLNFDLWLKLAEAHAVYCHDLGRATRIIRRLAGQRTFSSEQVRLAQAKLRGWQNAG